MWQTFDPIVTGAWAVASGLALLRLGRRSLGTIGVALGSAAVLFAVLRAIGVRSELVRFAVAAVFAVAIWSYVLGLTTWLLRDARGSAKRSAGDRGLIEPACSRASGPPDL